jgi:hypothetical protein
MLRIGFLLTSVALVTWPAAAGAQQAPGPLEGAAFMAGCWRGAAGPDRIIEEYYLPPAGNLMQGMTRYLGPRGNSPGPFTLDFEFTLLDVDHGTIRLRPHPRGQPSVAFAEKERSAGRLVWENAAHDFPQRIMYTAAPGDSLLARIEGRTPNGDRFMEWRMGRVPCPGAK